MTLAVDYPSAGGTSPVRLAESAAQLERRIFGTGPASVGTSDRSVNGFFRENSGEVFRWRNAGIVAPVHVPDDRQTTIDESRKTCAVRPQDCAGVGLVYFQSANGDYLGTDDANAISETINTRPGRPGPLQAFKLIDMNRGDLVSGDRIQLVTYHQHWLTAEGGGGSVLSVNRTYAANWEVFRIAKVAGTGAIVDGDTVTLQAPSSHYVIAYGGGGGEVQVDRRLAGRFGRFTFSEAPVDGSRLTGIALDAAERSGIDLTRYDVRAPIGRLDDSELGLLLMNAEPSSQRGATRQFPCQPLTRVLVCGRVSAVDEPASFTTVAHELTHQLGTIDMYGSLCHSYHVTLMSCTIGDAADISYHLDPWYKIQLGWIRPRIRAIPTASYPGDCVELDTAQVVAWSDRTPTIWYSPSRGTSEFLVVEHRNGGWGGYDRDVATSGVAIWEVQVDAYGFPREVPGVVIVTGKDGTLESEAVDDDVDTGTRIEPGPDRLLATPKAPSDVVASDRVDLLFSAGPAWRGGNTLWTSSDGLVRPTWMDGTPTGLTLRIGQPDRSVLGAIDLEVAGSTGFRPRINALPAPLSGRAGSAVELRGVLGVQAGSQVTVKGAGPTYMAQIRSWTCSAATVLIPASLPPGTYQLAVRNGGSGAVSNSVSFVITT